MSIALAYCHLKEQICGCNIIYPFLSKDTQGVLFRRSRTLENFAMRHRVLLNPRQYMSRYACRHALRKAYDSSNETHNRAICINDAPPDSEPACSSLRPHPPLSSLCLLLLLPLRSSCSSLPSTVSARLPRQTLTWPVTTYADY